MVASLNIRLPQADFVRGARIVAPDPDTLFIHGGWQQHESIVLVSGPSHVVQRCSLDWVLMVGLREGFGGGIGRSGDVVLHKGERWLRLKAEDTFVWACNTSAKLSNCKYCPLATHYAGKLWHCRGFLGFCGCSLAESASPAALHSRFQLHCVWQNGGVPKRRHRLWGRVGDHSLWADADGAGERGTGLHGISEVQQCAAPHHVPLQSQHRLCVWAGCRGPQVCGGRGRDSHRQWHAAPLQGQLRVQFFALCFHGC